LNTLNPYSDDDTLHRYQRFIEIGKNRKQTEIFEEYCEPFYPDDTRFVVLAMDMAFMGAGKVPHSYIGQLDELTELKNKYSQRILPIIHLDPRRDDYLELMKKYIGEKGFRGVKIYPSIGYFPYDDRLYPVYDYCLANDLPVMSHCSIYNPTYFKGKKKDLYELLSKSRTPIETRGKNKKQLCAYFAHPKNWEIVLNDFPNLRLCLSHFGSSYFWDKYMKEPSEEDNWFVIIKEMIPRYGNLYADISFTLSSQEYLPMLTILLSDNQLRSKILFGTDFYMVSTKTTERQFSVNLRAFIGESNFEAIAMNNPKEFFKD